MPEFPWQFRDYMRMTITDLTPTEYMETDVLDYELTNAVQGAYRAGQQDANTQRERASAEADRIAALKAKVGGQGD